MATIIMIYGFLAACLIMSLIKSKEKSKKALKVAGKALLKTAPSLLAVLGIVGLTLGILTAETISAFVTTLVMVGMVTAPIEIKSWAKNLPCSVMD